MGAACQLIGLSVPPQNSPHLIHCCSGESSRVGFGKAQGNSTDLQTKDGASECASTLCVLSRMNCFGLVMRRSDKANTLNVVSDRNNMRNPMPLSAGKHLTSIIIKSMRYLHLPNNPTCCITYDVENTFSSDEAKHS